MRCVQTQTHGPNTSHSGAFFTSGGGMGPRHVWNEGERLGSKPLPQGKERETERNGEDAFFSELQ